MKKISCKEKGITLIALIITIIVLLILAGVTLNMVMGESGIFSKANKAKKLTKDTSIIEDASLAILNEQSEYYSSNNSDKTLDEFLHEKFNGEYLTPDNAKLNYEDGNIIRYIKNDEEILLLADENYKLSITQKVTDGDNTYLLNSDGTYTIASYAGNDTEIVIPSEINGIPVTAIGNNFAKNNRKITKITMPDTIKIIGNSAFYRCTKVTEIHFPNSLVIIGENSFRSCGNSETDLVLPETVESIGANAFASYGSKKITNVYIGKNVKKMGTGALAITSLQNIEVSAENSKFKSDDGILYTKSGKTLIQYPIAKSDKTTFNVPDSVNTIGQYAFYKNKSLVNVSMSNTVKRIAKGAFYGETNLNSVTISSNLKTIENGTFEGTGITEIDLQNVQKIEERAFAASKLQTIKMQNISEIGKEAFKNSKVENITIPETTTQIGDSAFCGTNLTEIVIPKNVKSIGNSLFENCTQLTKATINCNITAVKESMFSGCNLLTSVIFSSKIDTFEKEAFLDCNSLTLVLPDTLTTVKECSVYGPLITNVPDSLKNIDDDSFGSNIDENLKTKILAINANGICEYHRGVGGDGSFINSGTIEYIYDEQ